MSWPLSLADCGMERAGGIRSRARILRVAVLSVALIPFAAPPLSAQRAAPASAAPREWTIDTSQSKLVIHVLPGGLLSPTLHPHHFQPEAWSGEITWDPSRPKGARVEVRISADSLHDHQEKLSPKDLAKVETQARGPAILDAAQFPEIVFRGEELEIAKAPPGGKGEFRGTLTGNLTLHGKTQPVGLAIQGLVGPTRFEASASAAFKQSDFGIKPYKTALGTISVKDEVTLEITIVALPGTRKPTASTTPSAAATPSKPE